MYQDILFKDLIAKWYGLLKVSPKGRKCPLCGKLSVWRPKYLDKRLIDELMKIYNDCKERKDRGFTARGMFGDSNERLDMQKLHYWDFIESSKSGWWKITNKGIDFAKGKIQVLEKIYISNNEVVLDEKGEPVGGDRMVRVNNAEDRWQQGRSDYTLDYIIAPRKIEIDWNALGYPTVDQIIK
jgi:hypothetical protein